MKKIISFLILAFFATLVFSQAPHSFRYQTVVRNNAGELLINHSVGIRISILSNSPTGVVVFSETYNLITSSVGLINLSVGTGAAETGSIEGINWGSGTYFMRIDVDKDGGNNYEFMGTSQLLSVPYALYAENAGNGGNNESELYWHKNDNSLFYNDGNIGIGTNQPQNALSIEGYEEEWPGRILLSIKNTSAGPKSLAYLKIYSGPGEKGTALGHASTTYMANESPEDVAGFGILASSDNGMIINATKPDLSPGIIKFFNGQTSGTKFIETMRINSNGNVGIGTANPIGKLNIVGNVDAGEERAFIRMKNNATGPTSSVSIALQAFDDKGVSFAYTSRDYAYNDLSDFGVVTTSGRGIALAPNHGQIRFYTSINPDNSYSEKMRITEEGNVGIGTTTPAAKVEIEDGDIYISSINKGVIMTSPDGQCWRGTINNSGVLEFSPAICP
jgi:hypothetical protein